MIEYHALHTQNRAARRIEELMIAGAVRDKSGKLFGKVWKFFQKQAGSGERGAGNAEQREPESQMPRSQAEFERMMAEENET